MVDDLTRYCADRTHVASPMLVAAVPLPAQPPAASANWEQVHARLDRMEAHIGQVKVCVDAAKTHIVEKLEQKDQLDRQRIEAAKAGWSKFILRHCLDTCVSILLRSLPLIIGIEIASGVAGGPIGLATSLGAVAVVAALVLAWQGYKAYTEYRALKASGALDEANCAIAQSVTDAGTPTRPLPVEPAAVGAPKPDAPKPTWRQNIAGFAHHARQRGIR